MDIELSIESNIKGYRHRLYKDKLVFESTSAIQKGFVALTFKIDAFNESSYLFIPACVYNGNKFESLDKDYPPMYNDCEIGVDRNIRITDVPRLNRDGSGEIEISAADTATPCVGIYSPGKGKEKCKCKGKGKGKGYLLFFSQGCKGHDFSISVKTGEISVCYPKLRKKQYRFPHIIESCDKIVEISNGEMIEIPYRIFEFKINSINELYEKFFENRKCLYTNNSVDNISSKELFILQENKFNTCNYNGQYYKVGCSDSKYEDWQTGWIGGGISTYPLLKVGSDLSKQRALSTLLSMVEMQTAAGWFYGIVKDGVRHGDGFDKPDSLNWHLIRKSGDALFFLIKQFEIMGDVPKPLLVSAIKVSDAFVSLWNQYGQFGQFVDCESGRLIVGNTTCGAIAVAALCKAGSFFSNPVYIDVAKSAAIQYYERDLKNGFTTGAPGDALACPDSESAFALLEGFVALYETTKEEIWLEYAITAANFASSWVMSYSYKFISPCEFDRLEINTVGSVFANIQNKHAAPGICTLSGDSLYKLYLWTKNAFYLDIIKDIASFIPQCISRAGRKITAKNGEILPDGYICERVNTSDWEGSEWVGNVYCGSCWCETSLLLTYADLSGSGII